MIVDSSAILAIIFREPGYESLLRALTGAKAAAVGAPTLLETAIVLSDRMRTDSTPILTIFLRDAELEVIPFTHEHYQVALEAFFRYGKGRHKAALNFGDCMAYSFARVAALPLLFTGRDFTLTDVSRPHLP